jgi:hypothetical protein
MTKYQNYNHFKIPITINPLEYGKLILKIDNIYMISSILINSNAFLLTKSH